jgi:hypothetical protein
MLTPAPLAFQTYLGGRSSSFTSEPVSVRRQRTLTANQESIAEPSALIEVDVSACFLFPAILRNTRYVTIGQ